MNSSLNASVVLRGGLQRCRSPRKYHGWHDINGGIWDGSTCAWCGARKEEVYPKRYRNKTMKEEEIQ